MANELQTIQNHSNFITSIYEDYEKEIKNIDWEFKQIIEDYIDLLDTADGKYVINERNFNLLFELENKLIKLYEEKGGAPLSSFLRRVNTIKENNIILSNKINDISVSENLLTPSEKIISTATINALAPSGIRENIIAPYQLLINNILINGYSIASTKALIKDIAKGEKYGGFGLKTPTLERYTSQIARDAVNQLNGGIQNIIKTKYELGATRYVGGKVEATRPFCKCLVETFKGGKIPNDVLSEYLKTPHCGYDKKDWLKGRIDGTNIDNFNLYRGGYNCMHEAYSVRL